MIKIDVPATTANVGPGFDCFGMSLGLYNHYEFFESEIGTQDKDNLITRSAYYLYDKAGALPEHFDFKLDANIPMSRGLGSSAACIVGGLVGANELLNRPFTDDEILEFATELEGHPDNVAPALLGGCVFSNMEGNKVSTLRLEVHPSIQTYVAIPNFKLSTLEARKVLPEHLSYAEAVFNIGHIPYLMEGLRQGQIDLIKKGAQDKLHQSYRAELIHGYQQMSEIEKKVDGKMLISGAGPTLLFLTDEQVPEGEVIDLWKSISEKTEHEWEILHLPMDQAGAYRKK